MYEYLLEGELLSFLCVFGIIANAFGMLYFGKQNLRKQTFYGFMFILSTIDLLFNATCLSAFSIPVLADCKGFESDDCNVSIGFWQCLVWLVPLSSIFRTGSIYFTLALSIERYLVLCRPLLYNSKSWITKGVKVGCILFSITFNLPKFFEFEWGTEKNLINGTLEEDDALSLISTSLMKNNLYIEIYLFWFDLIFHGLIPFTTLIVLNVFVFKEMKRYKKKVNANTKEGQKRFSEVYMAKFNFVVVIVFILCYSLHYVPVIYRCYMILMPSKDENYFEEPIWIWVIISLSRVLEAFNSSISFAWFLFKHRLIEKLVIKATCPCFNHQLNSTDLSFNVLQTSLSKSQYNDY